MGHDELGTGRAPDSASSDPPTAVTGPEAGSSHPAESAADTSSSRPREEGLSEVRIEALRSAVYHQDRQGFLELAHRCLMAGVLVTTSGAVVTAASGYSQALGAAAALFAILDMVFSPTTRARTHALLARNFLEVAAEALELGDKAAPGPLAAKLSRLYGEEPPTFEVVERLAYNHIARSMGSPDVVHVSRFHRLLRHVLRFSGTDFEKPKPH